MARHIYNDFAFSSVVIEWPDMMSNTLSRAYAMASHNTGCPGWLNDVHSSLNLIKSVWRKNVPLGSGKITYFWGVFHIFMGETNLYNCTNRDSSSQDLYIMTLTESSEGKMMSRQCVHCIVVAHSDAVSATKWQYVALWKLHRADG